MAATLRLAGCSRSGQRRGFADACQTLAPERFSCVQRQPADMRGVVGEYRSLGGLIVAAITQSVVTAEYLAKHQRVDLCLLRDIFDPRLRGPGDARRRIQRVNSADNTSDIFTKSLDAVAFQRLRGMMGLVAR